ncbi:hypothetical protein [Treponema putidum]|uniref:Uncharacterized protein n=1 Tax=Treponema putidum TaxID=221027 RepID=A0AAE9SIV6_9SPIR|nr:hypothetical protein [Treponema putidum]UTY27680.1 hypothetical protein E4N76_00770 [Treponema putidum]UTY32597.1 hypothetical protein E4N74_00120 [Treponema putidum]
MVNDQTHKWFSTDGNDSDGAPLGGLINIMAAGDGGDASRPPHGAPEPKPDMPDDNGTNPGIFPPPPSIPIPGAGSGYIIEEN